VNAQELPGGCRYRGSPSRKEHAPAAHAVVAEIRKLSATLTTPPSLYHWRRHGGGEVDLLLERDGRLHPIEIKLTTRPTKGNTRGLMALRTAYPRQKIAAGMVICPIERAHRLNNTDYAIPWDCR
jgi:hypothetical protein